MEHEASSASIVNIASLAARAGVMGQCNYAASKAGVVAFTKTSAIELARYNKVDSAIFVLVNFALKLC